MLSSRVTSKGQITLPLEVREALALKSGDKLVFEMPFDDQYYHALTDTLSEWNSDADDKAYSHLSNLILP